MKSHPQGEGIVKDHYRVDARGKSCAKNSVSESRRHRGRAAMLALFAVLPSPAVLAQQQAATTVQVEVETRAITLRNTGGLHFGRILPYGRNDNITVHTNGSPVASNALLVDASAVRAASREVNGTPGAPCRVALPASVIVDNGNAQMTISSLFRSGAGQLALDASGNGAFTVGGILDVGANQPAGHYAGNFAVTVSDD